MTSNPTPRKTPFLRAAIAGTVAVLAATSLVGSADAVPPTTSNPSTVVADDGRAEKPPPLLPDLTPLKAVDVYVEGRGDGRVLRFQAGLANIGAGPMEARPDDRERCGPGKQHSSQVIYRDVDRNGKFNRGEDTKLTRRAAGCMVFHPAHNHWHFQAASRYVIYPAGEEDQAIKHARKMSFCLRDTMRVPERYGSFGNSPLFYRECSQKSPQGISRGWVDVYASYLSGQAIPLPRDARNGLYCLQIQVDPLNRLWESEETNNISTRTIRIKKRTHVSTASNRICQS